VSTPTRLVKCQICPWQGTRHYGAKGILCEPCPDCGHRVAYAVAQDGDQLVTPDDGQVRQPSKPRKIMTPELKAKLAAGREASRVVKIAA
jgi:hypothetical protein